MKLLLSCLDSKMVPVVFAILLAIVLVWTGISLLLRVSSPVDVVMTIIAFLGAAGALITARYWATHDPVYPAPPEK